MNLKVEPFQIAKPAYFTGKVLVCSWSGHKSFFIDFFIIFAFIFAK